MISRTKTSPPRNQIFLKEIQQNHKINPLEDPAANLALKLALKVGTKKKYGNSTTTKSVANEGFVEGSNSWNPSGTKTTPS